MKLPKNKWAKFAIRVFFLILIAAVLDKVPEPYQIVSLEGRRIFVIALFDLVFTYYADWGPWKEDEERTEE